VYDGVVYFILEYVNRVDTYENELSIELRRLNGWRQVNRPATTPSGSNNDTESNPEGSCEAQFASKVTHESYFDIKVCSQLVAVIIRERYQKFAHYQSLEGLHIVSSGKSLHFYMQVDIYRI
jgi:hypothetical protein